jgi:hypothetical protein
VPELSVNFEGILSGSYGNFEEHNKVLEPSIITINYCIVIIIIIIMTINVYYNYIV